MQESDRIFAAGIAAISLHETPALKCKLAEWLCGNYPGGVKSELSREMILTALARLSELLRARGVTGEFCLLGGAVMVLAFKVRASTKDVDGIFAPAPVVDPPERIPARTQYLLEDISCL